MDLTPKIVQPLLEWFEENQRDLPWRAHYEPYAVWISEVMLQQTQVKTVLPYYERWMKELPNVASLAAADEQRVLKLWEGLGYYSRARNLKKAAEMIVEEFGGEFPSEHADLLKLPGVGPYTAGAIASIAFEQDYPVVDGNVIRVLARLADYREDVKPAQFWKLAQKLLPEGRARDFNQGLMEFGALMCTPKKASCENCPLQGECGAYASGTVNCIPKKKVRKSERIKVAIGVIRKGDKVFIQKRPAKGLMAGLWEFPGGKVELGESTNEALKREIREELGVEIKNVEHFMQIKHAYTTFLVDLHCFLADYDRGHVELTAASDGKWVSLDELQEFPFPAANVRLIEKLTE